MGVWSSLNSAYQQAAQQVYSGFYNYAIQQGADPTAATEFANLGLGTAFSEGLNPTAQAASPNNPWGPTGDNGASYGPLQLLTTGSGLGASLFNSGQINNPDAQIQTAAAMWKGPGTGGYYDTSPWFGVGRMFGGGNPFNNNTADAQSGAIAYGAQGANALGLSTQGPMGTGTPAPLPSYPDTVGAYMPNDNSGTPAEADSGTVNMGTLPPVDSRARKPSVLRQRLRRFG
jgi:hypothetical protein